jgi:valyl-tRNA synthetase
MDNYDPKEAEPRWQRYWAEHGIFRFDEDSKAEVYSIDTPPPTVSGKMHLGHAFSYAQLDFIARYKRMRGFNVFYPFGTDDNGLATDRLVEKLKGVKSSRMDRKDYVSLVLNTLQEIRPRVIADWKRIGMSCDFTINYSTINEHCQRISQRSFIELYKIGRAYRKDAPTMWCPACETAISQVELKDAELDSFFNDVKFNVDGKDLIIATTRPELIPACVAIVFNPEDKRYKALLGKKAKAPLFGFEVSIIEDSRVDMEKGTGIVMCCTFGDLTDMEWQKAFNLPIKEALGKDGKMTQMAGKYAGLKIKEARKAIIEDLEKSNLLINKRPIKHTVNVHERCETEIEILKTKQWFIKYLDLREDMLDWGAKLNWYPAHMKVRYDNWVKGLQWDWLISRQRFYGVPFPVWYCNKCGEVILAEEKNLPIDPLQDKPKHPCKCGSNDFTPEKDVQDTWATSSLTPQLSTELFKNKPIYSKLFPMSLRPQAHDIITFWLFNTTVKSNLHTGHNPWKDVIISGHAQDPHGKKMSKSKGNIIEPQVMIDKFSADALRFWAAGSKLGDDLPFQEKDLVTGHKTIIKLWNASKFALMHLKDYKHQPAQLTIIDSWLISKLNGIIKEATESFDNYEYIRTKMLTENFFWQDFCDNYLEFVKDRLYNPQNYTSEEVHSAQHTIYHALLNILKLFSPLMPHITEEIFQIYYADKENAKSVHVSGWPIFVPELYDKRSEFIGEQLVALTAAVRKFKSTSNLALNKPLKLLAIECDDEMRKEFELVMKDLKAISKAEEIMFGKGSIEVNQKIKISIVA